jgi:hypothetical protein
MQAYTPINPLPGAYPTETWTASYTSVNPQGAVLVQRVDLEVPKGLGAVCPPVQLGEPGCLYGVRAWGVILRPSSLEQAGFDPSPFLPVDAEDADWVRAILDAATFELPGGLILASPEHPFRLLGVGGTLHGSNITERSYLGALSFYLSEGAVDASFVRLLLEAPDSYREAVRLAQEALGAWGLDA